MRNATPEDATVSVVAPRNHGYYTIQAVFTLAPRRVVRSGDGATAGFVAIYKDDSSLALPGSRRIRNGVLIRR